MSTWKPKLDLTVTGRLSADPALKYTASGKAVAELSIPHTPRRHNQATGQWEDAGPTTWVNVTVWDADAEIIAERLRKGDIATITGRPTLDAYIDRNTGQPVAKLRLTAREVSIHPTTPQPAGHNESSYQTPSTTAPAAGSSDDPWNTSSYSDTPPF